ncbi:hypothetical protein V6N13_124036 [Hibiscus sabdariffa]
MDAKNRWEEQGFFFDDGMENYGLEPTIHSKLCELGWFHFGRQPARANLNWVWEFHTRLEEKDYETIKDFLCEQGTEGNTTGKNPHSVSRPSLWPEAKPWNTFVKQNLMPTSHNQTVNRTRLVLIHVIMTGYRFNVGEVIAQEMAAACQNDKGILAFPCIVPALCRRAAVPTSLGDKYMAEKSGWTRKCWDIIRQN